MLKSFDTFVQNWADSKDSLVEQISGTLQEGRVGKRESTRRIEDRAHSSLQELR